MNDLLAEETLEFNDQSIGEFLIDILTGGLYLEPHLVFREYIQNSHDAIVMWRDAPEPGRIDIKLAPPNIHIYDNGPGMSRDELANSMSKIGISSKPFGAASGFMGIGKLAGLSMAETVRIDSSKFGIPERNRVEFRSGEMLQAIEARRRLGESRPIVETLKAHSRLNKVPVEEPAESHYTAIHLLDVSDRYWEAINARTEFLIKLGLVAPVRQDPAFPHAAAIEEILSSIAPEHYYPLEIYVDESPLYRPWCENLLKPQQVEVLDANGDQLAYGWACMNSESNQIPEALLRGLALLQRGIAIGERTLAEELGLYGSSPVIYFRWFMGEIYLTGGYILLTANRMSMRHSEQASDLIERLRQELKKLSNLAAKFSQRDNAARQAPIQISTIEEVEEQVSTGHLTTERIPSTLNKLVRAREDLRKRRPHLPEADQTKAADSIRKADVLLRELAQPREKAASSLEGANVEDITVAEEELRRVSSITERLAFTDRERQIFQLIIGAIADLTGARDSETFARYLQRIEEVLSGEFEQRATLRVSDIGN